MEVQSHLFLLLLGAIVMGSCVAAAGLDTKNIQADYGIPALNRTSFPAAFVFGSGSAAYQYEGAAHEDGKGPSIWDVFTHKFPEKIADRSNGDVAVDTYHHYKEDVKLLKDMGADAHRFSFSWSRILPHGKVSKGVNQKGVAFYHNFIDELLANGIKPFVTLFHWDLPQALQEEYDGFLSPSIVDDFREYADFCFREFGEKVKSWVTMNEPWSFSTGGYVNGNFAPGRCSKWEHSNCTGGDSATEPYLVTHHLLLSHAAAVDVYKHKYQASQKGLIGITLVTHWFVPYSEVQHNQYAAMRGLDFMLGWFLDPISTGDYPRSMRSLVKNRLPKFTAQQSRMLKGSFDFLGINYYTSVYAAYAHGLRSAKPSYNNDPIVKQSGEKNGVPIGPKAASDWLHVYPRGIRDLLLHLKAKYNNPAIYITENGIDDDSKIPLKETLDDKMRVQYHHDHLAFINLALKEGANVRGYFAWSFLDDFEWDAGFTVRFGLHYVDHKNGYKRYPKLSALWFKKFLQTRA